MSDLKYVCSIANTDCEHYNVGLCKGACSRAVHIGNMDTTSHWKLSLINFNYLVKSLDNQREILQNQARILSLLENLKQNQK